MVPRIGQTVYYVNKFGSGKNCFAATITNVLSDTLVNLQVFYDGTNFGVPAGTTPFQESVSFDGSANPAPGTWHWPATTTKPAPSKTVFPVANAGPNQTGVVGKIVILSGALSTNPAGGSLSYEWSPVVFPVGSKATIENAGSEIAEFKPDLPGTYTVKLTVNHPRFLHNTPASSAETTITVTAV